MKSSEFLNVMVELLAFKMVQKMPNKQKTIIQQSLISV